VRVNATRKSADDKVAAERGNFSFTIPHPSTPTCRTKTIVAYRRTASASGSEPVSVITRQVNAILRYVASGKGTLHRCVHATGDVI